MHVCSVKEARLVLRDLWKSGKRIGSIHTLGALHDGHGRLIELSAKENDETIVTVYPNKIQLFPGSKYKFNLDDDVRFSFSRGATIVISSDDAEMYPASYQSFIDQGEAHKRLNSSIFDFATRGQVTGAIRWISLTRPHVSYFGMKDIEQALMVERACVDLLIDCNIRQVPCIRFRDTGVPISSRLLGQPPERLAELGQVYRTLEDARQTVLRGERRGDVIAAFMRDELTRKLTTFRLLYSTVVDTAHFAPISHIDVPFILHTAVTDGSITHFDGLCIRTQTELENSPDVIWLDA